MKFTDISPMTVDIYPVGLLRDLRSFQMNRKQYGSRHALRVLWSWFCSSYRRRSYWNGFLCEPIAMPQGMKRCGRGLTEGSAYRDYVKEYRRYLRAKQEVAS